MLYGKGLWAYRTKELDRAIQIAPAMGATHILYKVGQGTDYYDGMAQIALKIKDAGLVPLGWTWLLLKNPYAEAQVAIQAFQDGFQGLIFDTESKGCRNSFEQAVQLGRHLGNAGINSNDLYNCSFPNISHHRDLPYDQMNEFCKGGLMPMSYGSFFAPGSSVPPYQQAQRVIDDWTYGHYEYWCQRWGYRPPMSPVLGPYHDEYGRVRMSPGEFKIWIDRLAAYGPAFFSIFTAAVINDDLLPLIHAFPLDKRPAPKFTSTQVQVTSPVVGYLNVRSTPSTGQPRITQVDDGAILEALESKADVHAKVGQRGRWLRVRIPSGVEGYVAAWYLQMPPTAVSFGVSTAEPAWMEEVKVICPTASFMNVYRWPFATQEPPVAQMNDGDVLQALEPEANVWEKVGQENQWLYVRTADGITGYAPTQHLQMHAPSPTSSGAFTFGISSATPGVQVKVMSQEVGYLRVRPSPSTERPPIAQVKDGAVIDALEPVADVEAKVGQQGQWLHIRTPNGVEGYVAAWYLRKASVQVKVTSIEVGYLRIRPTPSTRQPSIARVDDGAILESLEPAKETREKVGQQGQWLHVRTPDGVEGYTAAWYLRLPKKAAGKEETIAPKIVAPGTPTPRIVVNSGTGLNIRQGMGTNTPITWHVGNKTVLDVLEDPAQAGGKVGKDHWIKIRTPSLHEGYVSGAYVQAEQLADKRKPVDPASVPPGECAWIFGIHGAGATTPVNFRFLFEGKNKTGWVLFTEAIGDSPNHGGGHDYTSWSGAGYGVIVRLNNGYEPAGTLPVRAKYPGFAQACARYVQNSKGCHIWIIGNEQNNVREHPGGAEHPIEHITPQRYAEAFNLARQRIKEVDPKAQVVLGAVDPYNTYPWAKMGNKRNRPLEYYKEMLSHVDDLDGITLHTYTHWMEVSLITSKAPFSDEFLKPGTVREHYYDFYAYRPFAEAIPAKWRDRPIYITESNHWLALDHRPRNSKEETKTGWVNKDTGWVQAAYAEINRWNNTPHVPQIHCLLLYRWTGDAWAIENRGEIHKDLKKALDHDYRWRR